MLRASSFLSLCAAALVGWAITCSMHQPQNAGPDVPAGKLKSVSFAPFREGFSPLEEKFPLPEHVAEDAALIAPLAESIRTYSSLGGLENLPDIARKHGMTITQGAWLGWGAAENDREIAALIVSAQRNPDVVKRVIVGNEVLLRGEMGAAQLIEYIRAVKRAVRQPVSYADVWSMYLKHPELIREVDFITIHILPYWEDEPVSIDEAPHHLEKVFRAVETEARALGSVKPIFIGESGWPSKGRQRGGAVPSVVNAARYTRSMIAIASQHGFDYNIVEAFNQPWKSKLEGIVGANWGLLSAERQPVYPLTGRVVENHGWRGAFAMALILALTAFLAVRPRLTPGGVEDALTLAAALLLAMGTVSFAERAWHTSYSAGERLQTFFWIAACGTASFALFTTYVSLRAGAPLSTKLIRCLRGSYVLFAFFALFRTYELALHGRYLAFPVEQYAAPVAGLVIVSLALRGSRRSSRVAAQLAAAVPAPRLLGALLICGALALFTGETKAFLEARDLRAVYPDIYDALPIAIGHTVQNGQLMAWAACLALLALPALLTRAQGRP